MELATDRPVLIGAAGILERPIPFTAIDAYARRAGISDPDTFDRFRNAIRTLDARALKAAKT